MDKPVVFREAGKLKETENWYMLDKPVTSTGFDGKTGEFYLMDDESTKFMESNEFYESELPTFEDFKKSREQ